jgi:hypothetical protein
VESHLVAQASGRPPRDRFPDALLDYLLSPVSPAPLAGWPSGLIWRFAGEHFHLAAPLRAEGCRSTRPGGSCPPRFGPSCCERTAVPCDPAASPPTHRFDVHRPLRCDFPVVLPISCCQPDLRSQHPVVTTGVPCGALHHCCLFFFASHDQGRSLWHLFPSRFCPGVLLISAKRSKEQTQRAESRREEQGIETSTRLARRTTDARMETERSGRALGGSEGAVSQWFKNAKVQGEHAVRQQSAPGARPKRSASQRAHVPALLAKGAEAFGFRGQVWTTTRVAHRIQQHVGVRSPRLLVVASFAASSCVSKSPCTRRRSAMRLQSREGKRSGREPEKQSHRRQTNHHVRR